MYTLIAFKPEKRFYKAGDWELLPARLIREDNLSTLDCIQKIVDLSTETPLVSYAHGEESDCEFEEFHVIPIEITKDLEDFVQTIKDDADYKIRIIRKEKEKEERLRMQKHVEKGLANAKEERRLNFLELEKEFSPNLSKGSLK